VGEQVVSPSEQQVSPSSPLSGRPLGLLGAQLQPAGKNKETSHQLRSHDKMDDARWMPPASFKLASERPLGQLAVNHSLSQFRP